MRFAVIIPYYNKEKEIERCLASIQKACESYMNEVVDVVVSDDGSKIPFSSKDIKDKYPLLRIIDYNHKNVGCAQARLLGIEKLIESSNLFADPMVVHVDPDDTIDESTFWQIDKWTARFPDVDVLIGNLRMYDSGIGIPYYVTPRRNNNKIVGKVYPTDIADIMNCGHPVVYKFAKMKLWSKCLRKSYLRVNCNEDLFLSALLYMQAKTVVYTDICHYNYEFGQPTSIMSGTTKGMEPRDSKLTYMLAGLLREVCNDDRR